jgi:hypothetical protein
VLGDLRARRLVGLVTYPIKFGPKSRPVTHWVPAWTLKLKSTEGDRY